MTYTTGKREGILNLLRTYPQNSFTLEQIVTHLCTDGKGRSTVYRLVAELVREEKLQRLCQGQTRHFTYQYVGDGCKKHLHLKCKGCGRLIHMDEELSHNVYESIVDGCGFMLDDGELLFGSCDKCSKGGGK